MTFPAINNWAIIGEKGFVGSPGKGTCVYGALFGQAHNHPRFKNGANIRTSYIIGRRGDRVVSFSGTEYYLGEPNPEYVDVFKVDKNAFMDKLPLL